MLEIVPNEVPVPRLHAWMLGSIAPRPIAFASTLDAESRPNLSPFSFFNGFGSNPPTLIFSPARRVRDNTTKHTLENVLRVPEVVINVVTYDMVQQASLASVEWPEGVNEFEKAGFTPLPSRRVKPFRVAESPVQMECKVVEVKTMGTGGGAANLIICELLMMHINEDILDAEQRIDQHKIDLVARLGGDWYVRASGAALFKVPKPNRRPAIGIDLLPENIRNSSVLTGNHLGMLGNTEHYPTQEELAQIDAEEALRQLQPYRHDAAALEQQKHLLAKALLEEHRVQEAWKVLLS